MDGGKRRRTRLHQRAAKCRFALFAETIRFEVDSVDVGGTHHHAWMVMTVNQIVGVSQLVYGFFTETLKELVSVWR